MTKLSRAQQKALTEITGTEQGRMSERQLYYTQYATATVRVLLMRGFVEGAGGFYQVTAAGRAALAKSLRPKAKRKYRGETTQAVKRRLDKMRHRLVRGHDCWNALDEIDAVAISARPSPTYQVEAGSISGDALLHGSWREG